MPTKSDDVVPTWAIFARALLYALGISLLVVFAPEEIPSFIYVDF